MFPAKDRVPAAELRIVKRHILARSPYFLVAAKLNGLSRARFAIVVGTKVDRRSVRRHTLKRRAADILKRMDVGARDLVVTILPAANTLKTAEFRTALQEVVATL